jgi:hypothetical protein
MIVTGAFLAEIAAVVDNKLQVSGGVLTNFMVGAEPVRAICACGADAG